MRLTADLGDLTAVASFDLLVKGRRRGVRIRVGVPVPSTPEERVPRPGAPTSIDPRSTVAMDLAADHKVPLSIQFTDEVGNPVDPPADSLVTFATDDASVLTVTDFGDGTAEAIPTGVLGSANVGTTVVADGQTLTGTLNIVVVAGLAERVSIVAGDPVEITPDT